MVWEQQASEVNRQMAESFNPYDAFLGLDEELTSPNHYQLLRLREGESDPGKIQAAADKAAARIRGQQPGKHQDEWHRVAYEIEAARSCLLDLGQRQAYDQRIGVSSSRPVNPAAFAPAMTFVPPPPENFAYPPGAGPAYSMPAPYSQPTYVTPPTDPMAPLAMPAPAAPAAYAWPTMPPAGPAVAPPVAPTNPHSFDPMAPVAFPAHSELPPQTGPRIVGFAGGTSSSETPIPFATAASRPVGTVSVASAAQPVEAFPAATLGLPSKPVSARPAAKRPSKMPLPLILSIGGGFCLLVVLLVVWGMNQNEPQDQPLAKNVTPDSVSPKPAVTTPPPKPAPIPVPQPEPEKVRPAPAPAPEPEPDPQPTVPEVKPVPKPMPEPEPPMPTAAELAELSGLMKEAKAALGDFSFAEAETALEQAAKVAKLPEHQAAVGRLKTLGEMAKRFRQAIAESMAQLEAGDVIKVGASTEAAVVESSPEKLVIRAAGRNRTYTLDDMPLGLAVSIGERSLSADDPKTPVFKGAYVFIDKRSEEAQLEKARSWWEEAQGNGVDISELLPVLTDTYEFNAEPPE